jgi:hypothetical protein
MPLLTVMLTPLVLAGQTSTTDAAPPVAEDMLGTACTAVIDQESISRSQTLAAEEDWAAFGFEHLADSS